MAVDDLAVKVFAVHVLDVNSVSRGVLTHFSAFGRFKVHFMVVWSLKHALRASRGRRVQLQAPSRLYSSAGFAGM